MTEILLVVTIGLLVTAVALLLMLLRKDGNPYHHYFKTAAPVFRLPADASAKSSGTMPR